MKYRANLQPPKLSQFSVNYKFLILLILVFVFSSHSYHFILTCLGFATRLCISESQWGAPNVSECQTVEQIRLLMRAEELDELVNDIFTSDDRDFTQTFESEVIVEITDDLADITNTTQPILPNDVSSASETLNIVLL